MFVRRMAMGSVLLGMVLTAGVLFGEQQPTSKARGKLPRFWSKLGLSDEQRHKIGTIQADYKVKIDALRTEISKLQDDEKRELVKILTSAQKDELRRIVASQALSDVPASPKAGTKTKEGKKSGNK